MLLSLYWITQFFHAFMSFVVGGCILWIFAKDESEEELNNSIVHFNILNDSRTDNADDQLHSKLLLYILYASL